MNCRYRIHKALSYHATVTLAVRAQAKVLLYYYDYGLLVIVTCGVNLTSTPVVIRTIQSPMYKAPRAFDCVYNKHKKIG